MEEDRRYHKRYRLAPGTQVRDEDFGLLFYIMEGPRLFFLSSGELLSSSFFLGKHTIDQWIKQKINNPLIHESCKYDLVKSLDHLQEKGVIIEC